MPDAKTSALPVGSALTDADLIALVNAGTSKQYTLNQLTAYFEQRARQNAASVAVQSIPAAADTYLAGSGVVIPANPQRLQIGSMYKARVQVTKTAAGTAALVMTVRVGTTATTADVTRATITFAVQTAVADEGWIDVCLTFQAVGASAVVRCVGVLDHRLAVTGLTNVNTSIIAVTSAAFDVTAATRIGLAMNGGASFAGTVNLVQAELSNLA